MAHTTDAPRKAGRPRLTPPVRVVLHLRPEDKAELLTLAHGRQITAFLLDCARYAAAHRPTSRVERPVATVYLAQQPNGLEGPVMQVVRDTYKDGRWTERYTGIEYATLRAGQIECARLNVRPARTE